MLIKFSHSIIFVFASHRISTETATCTWCSILLYVIKNFAAGETKSHFASVFMANLYLFLSSLICSPYTSFSFAAISYLYTKRCHKKIVYKYKAEEKISILLCLMWIIKKYNLTAKITRSGRWKERDFTIRWRFSSSLCLGDFEWIFFSSAIASFIFCWDWRNLWL